MWRPHYLIFSPEIQDYYLNPPAFWVQEYGSHHWYMIQTLIHPISKMHLTIIYLSPGPSPDHHHLLPGFKWSPFCISHSPLSPSHPFSTQQPERSLQTQTGSQHCFGYTSNAFLKLYLKSQSLTWSWGPKWSGTVSLPDVSSMRWPSSISFTILSQSIIGDQYSWKEGREEGKIGGREGEREGSRVKVSVLVSWGALSCQKIRALSRPNLEICGLKIYMLSHCEGKGKAEDGCNT